MKSRKPGTFEKGNKASVGNKGGGRTPDWVKAQCDKILDKCKLFEFLGDVVSGKDVEQAVGDQGEVIRIPPSVRDRLKAAEMLLDRRFGKVTQPLEHSGTLIHEIAERMNESRRRVSEQR